jgi:Divergent AAA domain.
MQHPRFVRSRPDLAEVVKVGETAESLCLEFKSAIDGWRVPKGTPNREELQYKCQKETCRDIAQFANAVGGCLLVGVQETPNAESKLILASGFAPVDDPQGLVQWIEQAIKKYLVPSTFRYYIDPIEIEGGRVISVSIPPSRYLVALWDHADHTLQFVYRTSDGKKYMNPDETERHRMDGTRAAKIAFEQAKADASVPGEVEVASGYWLAHPHLNQPPTKWTPKSPAIIGSVRDSCFELHIPRNEGESVLTIPYGLVRETWVGARGRQILLLAARLVVDENTMEAGLEPF